MIKKITAAVIVAFVASAGSSFAADMPLKALKAPPLPPVFSWTGFYLGVNGGGAWGRSNHTATPINTTTNPFNISGGMVGGTIGYNWQQGPFVFGLEADIDGTDIKGSTVCPNPAFTCETRNQWLATQRLRLGWAADRALIYITGGAAEGDVRVRDFTPGASFAATETQVGWAAGGGVEFSLWSNWSAKAEYLHIHLSNFDCTTACQPGIVPAGSTDSVRFNVNTFRVGLNYRFGSGPIVARY